MALFQRQAATPSLPIAPALPHSRSTISRRSSQRRLIIGWSGKAEESIHATPGCSSCNSRMFSISSSTPGE